MGIKVFFFDLRSANFLKYKNKTVLNMILLQILILKHVGKNDDLEKWLSLPRTFWFPSNRVGDGASRGREFY